MLAAAVLLALQKNLFGLMACWLVVFFCAFFRHISSLNCVMARWTLDVRFRVAFLDVTFVMVAAILVPEIVLGDHLARWESLCDAGKRSSGNTSLPPLHMWPEKITGNPNPMVHQVSLEPAGHATTCD